MRRLVAVVLLATVACSNEEPEWRTATTENTIPALATFLDAYPDGEFADSAREGLTALYRARALEARPLTEVIYLRREGGPRALQDADGEVIARYFRESGSWLTVEEATGDTLYATSADSSGEPTAPRWICLDESGTILRVDGEPLLVEPFEAQSMAPRGSVISRDEYDPYGRPDIRYVTKFGCINCAEESGNRDCVFIW